MKNKVSINLELSLVEIIISILIFAIAGAIMLNCFAAAKFTQIKANDKVEAGNRVQSIAEMIKSFDSSTEADVYLAENFSLQKLNGNEGIYMSYYDKYWNICGEEKHEYSITVKTSDVLTSSGETKEFIISSERAEPYPFIDKNKETDNIYEIKTKKFFPNYAWR